MDFFLRTVTQAAGTSNMTSIYEMLESGELGLNDLVTAEVTAAENQGWSLATVAMTVWNSLPESVTNDISKQLTDEQIAAMFKNGVDWTVVAAASKDYMRSHGITPHDVVALIKEHCPLVYSKYFAR